MNFLEKSAHFKRESHAPKHAKPCPLCIHTHAESNTLANSGLKEAPCQEDCRTGS